MEIDTPQSESQLIDTDNFWHLFLVYDDPIMKRITENRKLRMGKSWQKFVEENSIYSQTRDIVLRFKNEYGPARSKFIELYNDGKVDEANALIAASLTIHKDLLDEFHRKLDKAFRVLESLGADRKDLFG